MAWYIALLNSLGGFVNRGKLSKVQQPCPLPSKRINLTQESLFDQVHHAQCSSSVSPPQTSSLRSTHTSAPAIFSPLLALPFELRIHIYELALGGHVLKIRHKYSKIAHERLSTPYTTTDRSPLLYHGASEAQPILFPNNFSTTGLPLLLTCRSIYREAIHLLYASNTFFISDLSVLTHWADLPLLRPQRLAQIRHLSVRWVFYNDPEHFVGSGAAPYNRGTWIRFWEIVATRMSGLKELELRLEYLGRREEVVAEKAWVKAMMGVRRIKTVTVEIVFRTSPWAGVRCEEVEKMVKDAWIQEGYGTRED